MLISAPTDDDFGLDWRELLDTSPGSPGPLITGSDLASAGLIKLTPLYYHSHTGRFVAELID